MDRLAMLLGYGVMGGTAMLCWFWLQWYFSTEEKNKRRHRAICRALDARGQ